MLNHLIKSERAARDAFLSDDYYDGVATNPGDGIIDLTNTLWFSAVVFLVCNIAIAWIFMLA